MQFKKTITFHTTKFQTFALLALLFLEFFFTLHCLAHDALISIFYYFDLFFIKLFSFQIFLLLLDSSRSLIEVKEQ